MKRFVIELSVTVDETEVAEMEAILRDAVGSAEPLAIVKTDTREATAEEAAAHAEHFADFYNGE